MDYEEGETGIISNTIIKEKDESILIDKEDRNDLLLYYVKSLNSKMERIEAVMEKLVSILDIK